MEFLKRLLRRPRSTWLWKVNFQVHLWLGILLTLYLVVIGITGSILVFRVELERLCGIRPSWNDLDLTRPRTDIEQVLRNVQAAYPGRRVVSVVAPDVEEPTFVTTVQGRGERIKISSNPQTGAVIGLRKNQRTWLSFVSDLHIYLLMGIKGRVINGIGGGLLLLINLSGLVIWWPGIRLWRRGLTVDLRRRWRRVNFDLHVAVGFWAISFISVWALSAIYFAWPQEMFTLVNRFSEVVSAQPPIVSVSPTENVVKVDLPSLIAKAYLLDPGTSLAGVNFPYSRRAPFEILMLRPGGRGREYTDVVYFSPWDGKLLKMWRYGVNETLGDWMIWLQVPLHFGTFWGFGVKLVWCFLGMTVPLLAVSGVLMYWNRHLRHLKMTHKENATRLPSEAGA